MNPTRFAQCNIVMTAPKGMENCVDVDAYRGQSTDGENCTTTAWKPTPEELVRINLGEPVFVIVWGNVMPPISVVCSEIFNETKLLIT